MDSRVLKKGKCIVTQGCNSGHVANDLVGEGYTLDYVVSHSDGVVVGVVNNCNENTSGLAKYGSKRKAVIYGNYVKIKHDNGMFTLYAHMKYGSISATVGQRVTKGTVLGYMGNTGYSFGAHLHFEVRDVNNNCIDPSNYINADLPTNEPVKPANNKYKMGDKVVFSSCYKSSTAPIEEHISADKMARNHGTITKIVEARNPYLLDNGLCWVNDGDIREVINESQENKYKVGQLVVYSSCYRGNNDVPPNYIDCKKQYGAWQQDIIKEIVGGKNPYKLNNGLFVNDGDIREVK